MKERRKTSESQGKDRGRGEEQKREGNKGRTETKRKETEQGIKNGIQNQRNCTIRK
jgi:hypothetical protein